MAANINPIYSRIGDVSSNGTTGMGPTLTAGTNDYTGVSANNLLVFTSDSVEGSYIRKLKFVALGTNVATVARVYINNGSTPTTATNNVLYGQISLPATTASANAATNEYEYSIEIALNVGFRVYVCLATTVAAGWSCTGVGGKY